jgi:hypothetical protein
MKFSGSFQKNRLFTTYGLYLSRPIIVAINNRKIDFQAFLSLRDKYREK